MTCCPAESDSMPKASIVIRLQFACRSAGAVPLEKTHECPIIGEVLCRHGGTGRRAGLKIPFRQRSAGSIPAGGRFQNLVFSANSEKTLRIQGFFCLERSSFHPNCRGCYDLYFGDEFQPQHAVITNAKVTRDKYVFDVHWYERKAAKATNTCSIKNQGKR